MRSRKLASITGIAEDSKMDNSSMIDMVFQLLLFFMVSSHLIEHHKDPRVIIPSAVNGKSSGESSGRIILNIYADGTFSDEFSKPLADSSAVTQYVRTIREAMPPTTDPKILVRGDKTAVVKYAKEAVKAAAIAGVHKIVFCVSPKS